MNSRFYAHEPSFFALPIALGDGAALVFFLPSLGKRQQNLGTSPLAKVNVKRYEACTLTGDRTREACNLPFGKQELARCARFEAGKHAPLIFGDVGVEEPEFTRALSRPGIAERGPPEAKRLHFRAFQHQPGLQGFTDGVVEPRLAVLGDYAMRDQTLAVPASGHIALS